MTVPRTIPGVPPVPLVWDLVPGAQGYKIYRAGTGYQMIGIVGALTNTFVDTGLSTIPGGPPATAQTGSTADNTHE